MEITSPYRTIAERYAIARAEYNAEIREAELQRLEHQPAENPQRRNTPAPAQPGLGETIDLFA